MVANALETELDELRFRLETAVKTIRENKKLEENSNEIRGSEDANR
jgi:hypothetical protein